MRKLMPLIALFLILPCGLIAQQAPQTYSMRPDQPELGKWWKNSEIVKRLDLSEDQVSRIEQIFLSYAPQLSARNEELKRLQAQLRDLMSADPVNEAQVMTQNEEISRARTELDREYTGMALQFRRILTKEQWEKLYGTGQLQNSFFVGGRKPPETIYQPLPSYTDEARNAKIEGIVILRATIRKDGTVANIRVLRGLGYGLDESAIHTITSKWKFKPGTINGEPVDMEATIEISFRRY